MAQQARPCPLCGHDLAEGVPMEILEEHFQRCSKTDDRAAPRREWDAPSDGTRAR